MYTKSEIRHACYRAKKGAATEKNWELLSKCVEPLLGIEQRWENFGDVWDILVNRKDQTVSIIKPESNYDKVHSACVEYSTLVKHGLPVNKISERVANIVEIVENGMLDNIMSWETYGDKWGVEVDVEQKLIKTRLFTEPSQIEVTDEMIAASLVRGPQVAAREEQPVELEAVPMTDEQVEAFKKMLSNTEKPKTRAQSKKAAKSKKATKKG